jgi:hypothetical protein
MVMMVPDTYRRSQASISVPTPLAPARVATSGRVVQ